MCIGTGAFVCQLPEEVVSRFHCSVWMLRHVLQSRCLWTASGSHLLPWPVPPVSQMQSTEIRKTPEERKESLSFPQEIVTCHHNSCCHCCQSVVKPITCSHCHNSISLHSAFISLSSSSSLSTVCCHVLFFQHWKPAEMEISTVTATLYISMGRETT